VALIEGALEQGERLGWLGSPTIVAMLAGGAFLLIAAAIRRWSKPNPLVNLRFLLQRNILILGGGLFTMRFALLSILVLVPGYLGAVQGYRPLETGRVLLWLAIPVLVMGVVAARVCFSSSRPDACGAVARSSRSSRSCTMFQPTV